MKKILTTSVIVLILSIFLTSLVMIPVFAGETPPEDPLGLTYGDKLELGKEDPRDIAARLITIILSFLGIVAVIIILIGGFKWMIAGGNEEQVGEARKILIAGVIGLAIILAAWGIATFVLGQLLEATTGT